MRRHRNDRLQLCQPRHLPQQQQVPRVSFVLVFVLWVWSMKRCVRQMHGVWRSQGHLRREENLRNNPIWERNRVTQSI